jgi:heterodisulfide reductase subunit C/nitrate reductase gamma subunit
MFFYVSLYLALLIFVLSLLYKVSCWFRLSIGGKAEAFSFKTRVFRALRGLVATLLSRKVAALFKVFFLDVLCQRKVLRQDLLRWVAHMAIFWGFTLLVVFHALDAFVTAKLFQGYYPTLNPFLTLRDLFGALVIFGMALGLFRRFALKKPRVFSHAQDVYVLVALGVIGISGPLLLGAKMASYTTYQTMVKDYTFEHSEKELLALEAYWVNNFGLVSPTLSPPFPKETLELGKTTHEQTCASCHSGHRSAFLSFRVAKAIRPIALALDRVNFSSALYYLHFLAVWFVLAYLPFSKMFHAIAGPLSLLANTAQENGGSDPANVATRQVMELDACTHCGMCSINCSVAIAYEELLNAQILPSEKMASIKAFFFKGNLTEEQLRDLQGGVNLCTSCLKCTVTCPVGINLQDLWFNVREGLLSRGYPEPLTLTPLSYSRGLLMEALPQNGYAEPVRKAFELLASRFGTGGFRDTPVVLPQVKAPPTNTGLSFGANTFIRCFGCMTCTLSCPVVAHYENPKENLGLLPHQIMHACGMGLSEGTFGSGMLWNCLTCYQCQERCPQKVAIVDVFYELRNLAIQRLKGNALQEGRKAL